MTDPDPALLLAQKIVRQFYSKTPDSYSGKRLQIALAAIRETTELAAAYIQSPEGIPSHIFPDVISALRANLHLEKGPTDDQP